MAPPGAFPSLPWLSATSSHTHHFWLLALAIARTSSFDCCCWLQYRCRPRDDSHFAQTISLLRTLAPSPSIQALVAHTQLWLHGCDRLRSRRLPQEATRWWRCGPRRMFGLPCPRRVNPRPACETLWLWFGSQLPCNLRLVSAAFSLVPAQVKLRSLEPEAKSQATNGGCSFQPGDSVGGTHPQHLHRLASQVPLEAGSTQPAALVCIAGFSYPAVERALPSCHTTGVAPLPRLGSIESTDRSTFVLSP